MEPPSQSADTTLAAIVSSAPARADFLNTHQDYKRLPVIPVALNLRTYLSAKPTNNGSIRIRSLDLEKYHEPAEDRFQIRQNELLERGFFGNYLRGAINVIAKQGLLDRIRGLDITVKSEIPIGSGLASSAALEVAFVTLLDHAFKLNYTKKDVAEISFQAENEQLGIPCGRLDQYGVTYGGIIKLECEPPYKIESLPFTDLILAVVDSGIRHSTSDIHPKRQAELDRGLKRLMADKSLPKELRGKLGERFDEPRWKEISETEINDFLSVVDTNAKRRILFTIRMNGLTEFALKILRSQAISEEDIVANLGQQRLRRVLDASANERHLMILGQVMNEQHSLLRDLYDVSLPKIEDIHAAALSAGAYGAKISGAGMGGSVIVLVKDEKSGQRVVKACLAAGARSGWVSTVGEGARIESTRVTQ